MNQALESSSKVRPPGGTQAVIRAIHLLKAVALSPQPMSLDELSGRLNLAKPTVHRILSALISEGMIEQDPSTKHFLAGRELLSLGANSLKEHDLRSLVRPLLEKLVSQFGETATLEIPLRREMLILDEVVSNNLVGAQAEIGTSWPMYATSSGKMALAMFDHQALDEYLQLPRMSFTQNTITTKSKLLEALDIAKKRRFAMAEGELQESFNAVSAPILDAEDRLLATLSIGGPSDRLNRSTMKKLGVHLAEEAHQLKPLVSLLSL